jgi:hypothetical protein
MGRQQSLTSRAWALAESAEAPAESADLEACQPSFACSRSAEGPRMRSGGVAWGPARGEQQHAGALDSLHRMQMRHASSSSSSSSRNAVHAEGAKGGEAGGQGGGGGGGVWRAVVSGVEAIAGAWVRYGATSLGASTSQRGPGSALSAALAEATEGDDRDEDEAWNALQKVSRMVRRSRKVGWRRAGGEQPLAGLSLCRPACLPACSLNSSLPLLLP